MENGVVAALSFIGLVIFFTGFFVGRAERSSARTERAGRWEPTEHGRRPL